MGLSEIKLGKMRIGEMRPNHNQSANFQLIKGQENG